MRDTGTGFAVIAATAACLLSVAGQDGLQAQVRPQSGERRTIEPRLSSGVWQPCRKALKRGRLVEEAECGAHISPPRVSVAVEACYDMTTTHQSAVRTLVRRPQCTNAAVEGLEKLATARPSAPLLSDLAAAYYVRAQRKDRPSDFLRAAAAAERALALKSDLPQARFNRALALEALGLDVALAAWDEVRRVERTPWAKEADTRRRRLVQDSSLQAAMQWSLTRRRLRHSVERVDANAIARMVSPFPASAQKYVEEEVLPAWAQASSEGRSDAAGRHLELATVIARQVARSTGDRYLLEAVEAIAKANPAMLPALQQGHIALREGRLGERLRPNEAIAEYERAADALTRAKSPMVAGAEVGRAIAMWIGTAAAARSRDVLEAVERQARPRGHSNIVMRVASNRANLLLYEERPIEALAQYDTAIRIARRMNDGENAASFHTRKAGIFRMLGQNELASREAYQALRQSHHMADAQSRHHLFGENAFVALAHGLPAVALAYQNQALAVIDTELARTPPAEKATLDRVRSNKAIALRGRGQIHLRLGRYMSARADVDEAIRLVGKPSASDDIVRNALLARTQEVAGQAALGSNDAPRAVAAFSAALDHAFPGEYRTFRAMLLAQRAEAHAMTGNAREAERDLRAAVEELHREEKALLKHRRAGAGEELWPTYFSRSREAYERLIRLLIEDGRGEEAFLYAEKARSFEPLDLMRQRGVIPDELRRKITRDGRTLPLREIQRAVPAGTFLIDYYVLGDRTQVWIVANDRFEGMTLPVSREAIEGWSERLQRNAAEGNRIGAQAALDDAYDALAAAPLARVRQLAGPAASTRLVFIPDGAIHGLPFGALRDRKRSRFVLEDSLVAVASSATFYVYSRSRDRELSAERVPAAFLISDPAFDEQLELGLDRLPWARSEVTRIARLYPSAVVREDRGATVPEFLRLASESEIVHFAGHAVANPEAPFRSLLLFAPSGDHSGVLHADELLAKLGTGRTRLVVLAACSSAGGESVGPQGLGPLVRPIITAGVPGVIGTLWNVRDVPSEELFVVFHRHYRNGEDADAALRLAQIDLMHRKETALRSVLAWAPFQVVGHASSPFPPKKHSKEE